MTIYTCISIRDYVQKNGCRRALQRYKQDICAVTQNKEYQILW